VEKLGSSGLLWVLRSCHIGCSDPRYAQSIGAARTIRSEMLLDVATCEVDDIGSSLDRIVDVFVQFQARANDESLKPDFEYAIVDGKVYVGRIYPFLLEDEITSSSNHPENHQDQVQLDMAKPGRLTSLQWLSCESERLSNDDVEVQIYAAGLNFRV
jgi:hypothetical protein